MALMRSKSLDEIISGIRMQDAQAFTGVKGLGKKTAAKMVFNVARQIGVESSLLEYAALKIRCQKPRRSTSPRKLGFSTQQIRGVLSQIPADEHETSEVVRIALKELMTK